MIHLDIKYDFQAKKAWVENRFICIKLTNDTEFRFPASKNRKLAQATNEQLNNLELICDGTGLHWVELDEDLSISGIIEGRLDV
jgi:hypothetical protein